MCDCMKNAGANLSEAPGIGLFAIGQGVGIGSLVAPDVDTTNMSASVVISTSRRDRQREKILADGLEIEEYRRNPVVLWEHGLDPQIPLPVGRSESPTGEFTLRRNGDAWEATCFFAQSSPIAVQIFGLVAEKVVRAASVQALPYANSVSREMDPEDGQPVVVIGRAEMVEWSWGRMGINPDAVRKCLSIGKVAGEKLSPALMKSLSTMVPKGKLIVPGVSFQNVPSVKKTIVPGTVAKCGCGDNDRMKAGSGSSAVGEKNSKPGDHDMQVARLTKFGIPAAVATDVVSSRNPMESLRSLAYDVGAPMHVSEAAHVAYSAMLEGSRKKGRLGMGDVGESTKRKAGRGDAPAASRITTKNPMYGFWGTTKIKYGTSDKETDDAFHNVATALMKHGLSSEQSRDMLDASIGRHLADATKPGGELPAWTGKEVKRFMKGSKPKSLRADALGVDRYSPLHYVLVKALHPRSVDAVMAAKYGGGQTDPFSANASKLIATARLHADKEIGRNKQFTSEYAFKDGDHARDFIDKHMGVFGGTYEKFGIDVKDPAQRLKLGEAVASALHLFPGTYDPENRRGGPNVNRYDSGEEDNEQFMKELRQREAKKASAKSFGSACPWSIIKSMYGPKTAFDRPLDSAMQEFANKAANDAINGAGRTYEEATKDGSGLHWPFENVNDAARKIQKFANSNSEQAASHGFDLASGDHRNRFMTLVLNAVDHKKKHGADSVYKSIGAGRSPTWIWSIIKSMTFNVNTSASNMHKGDDRKKDFDQERKDYVSKIAAATESHPSIYDDGIDDDSLHPGDGDDWGGSWHSAIDGAFLAGKGKDVTDDNEYYEDISNEEYEKLAPLYPSDDAGVGKIGYSVKDLRSSMEKAFGIGKGLRGTKGRGFTERRDKKNGKK